jgi:hypothetical protein
MPSAGLESKAQGKARKANFRLSCACAVVGSGIRLGSASLLRGRGFTVTILYCTPFNRHRPRNIGESYTLIYC